MQTLSSRQQTILHRVVDTYIDTAQPVGSQSITSLFLELYRGSYSSATVRHEMGILEEKGYLTHPHTSAGRVPTDLGYRFYVDHGLKPESPSESIFRDVVNEGPEDLDDLDRYAEKMSRFFASLADQITVVLLGRSPSSRENRVYVQGSSRLLEKPEFQDAHKARPLFEALEEKDTLVEWLAGRSQKPEVHISIGMENEAEALNDCAVLSRAICVQGKPLGVLAVLGPRRMKYRRLVPLVEHMAHVFRNTVAPLFSE